MYVIVYTVTRAHSKIGSLENVDHTPGGGDKKVHDAVAFM